MSPLGAACAVTAAFAAPIAVVDVTLSRRGLRTISAVWWDSLQPGTRWFGYGVGVTIGTHLYRRACWPRALTVGGLVAAGVLAVDRRTLCHVP